MSPQLNPKTGNFIMRFAWMKAEYVIIGGLVVVVAGFFDKTKSNAFRAIKDEDWIVVVELYVMLTTCVC